MLADDDDDEGNGLSRFVNGIAALTYRYAWPTAKYSSFECCQAERADGGGRNVLFRLHGQSAFDGGDLWTDVIIALGRDWSIQGMRFGKNNALIAQPGETMGAIGQVLLELNAEAQRQNGGAPPDGPGAGGDQPAPEPSPAPEAPPPPVPYQTYAAPGDTAYVAAAPGPESAPSDRLHDGFYWRMSAGFGSVATRFDDKDPSGKKIEGSGETGGFELMAGGSPVPGLAVGGALLGEGGTPSLKRGTGRARERSVTTGMIGPFIDGFPLPRKGFHLGAMVGLGTVLVDDQSDTLRNTIGGGGAVWIGYDFWIAKQWSLGPLLRFSGTLTQAGNQDGRDLTTSTGSVDLLFTALYH